MRNWLIPFTFMLTVIVTTLKCVGVLHIEWWQCSIPVLVGICLSAIIFIVAIVSVFIYALWVRYRENRDHRC